MKKNDFILIISVFLIGFLMIFLSNGDDKNKFANVYYENELVLQIDLNLDNIYQVQAENGMVVIEVKNKKIRVKEENSKYHICKNQGFINSSNQMLVCMPNKLIIKIEGNDLDAIAK